EGQGIERSVRDQLWYHSSWIRTIYTRTESLLLQSLLYPTSARRFHRGEN
ncbi:hypothetical protein BgiBS90_016927, partial [Biomphalaria glabrata]